MGTRLSSATCCHLKFDPMCDSIRAAVLAGNRRRFASAALRFDPPLDPGIAGAVTALRAGGVETFESCEGGPTHAYTEPTIRFFGDQTEGFRAISVALRAGLQVRDLRRTWPIVDSEPTGPWWELTLVPTTASPTG